MMAEAVCLGDNVWKSMTHTSLEKDGQMSLTVGKREMEQPQQNIQTTIHKYKTNIWKKLL